MSIGTFLAYQLEPLLNSFKAFLILMLLFFFVTGIFNAVWASLINNELWKLLENGKILGSILISISVLGFSSFLVFLIICTMLYLCGEAFRMHLLFLIINIISIIGDIVLLAFSIHYSSKSMEDKYLSSFSNLLNQNDIPDVIISWQSSQKCATISSCILKAENYVHKRIFIGFVFNIVLVACSVISILGLLATILLMSLIKPVDRNVSTSENDDITGNSESSDKQTDLQRQRRESEIEIDQSELQT
ncbi:hypothetical protein TRFO_32843 [Tritrichomonas foetus]|uniref:Tetraspanin family protein n=1 Tax=Tritrichomonas foetus TaxID=1144522 RepID=A0A1J4JSH8_9EUKA|nr:hypothetical protein TRFO_32843 [Tritrichomonas foetus]|eukprot:OHT00478.1 hypothetical protein TRFO_32843 [Tritrichomonas foetus]